MAEHFRLDERPTEHQVNGLLTRLQQLWKGAHSDWTETDSYVNATYDMWPRHPDRKVKLYTGKAPSKLRAATDVLVPFMPKFHRPPPGKGEEHKADANTVENFLSRMWKVAGAKEAVEPGKALWHHLMRYGYAVSCGTKFDESYRREKPRKRGDEKPEDYAARVEIWEETRRNWCPFRYEAPHPASVLMNPFEATPRVALVSKRMFAVELAEEVERAGKRNRQAYEGYVMPDDPYEVVNCIEFWSAYWRGLMLQGGALLYVEPNRWGFQPYTHGFAGWGSSAAESFGAGGADLGGQDPRYMAKGILTDALPLLRALDQQQTAKHNVMMTAAFLHRTTTKDPAEASRELAVDGWLTGPEGTYAWEKMPEFSQSLFKLTDETLEGIEETTVRGSVAGIRTEGVTTVGQQALLSAAGLLTFGTAIGQMERFATAIGRNCLQLVSLAAKTYGMESFTVGEVELKAEQLHRNFVVAASFEVVNPTVRLQEKQTAMEELERGAIGLEQYWKAARYEDTTAIEDAILRDRAMRRPEMVEAMDAITIKALGFDELAEKMKERLKEERLRRKMMAEGWTPPQQPGQAQGQVAQRPTSPMAPTSPQMAATQMRNGLEAAGEIPGAEAQYGE